MKNSYTPARSFSFRKKQKKSGLIAFLNILKNFKTLSFFLIFFLLGLHIFQINDITKNSHLAGIYEQKIENISQKNKNLEIAFYQKNNLDDIETELEKQGYEKIVKILYIQPLEGGITIK